MASGTRSSKRKSSPSLKKKRRTKDRSKKRIKLGGGKPKKVYRRESSDSYSDDESLSSDSKMLSSSTDSDRRRSRSRTRKDTTKRRKKSTRRRVRSESSDDTIHVRRAKRWKKRKGLDAKKKRIRRKRRREQSVSSSSRSVSCSTCGSSDDSEGEREGTGKRRGRSNRDLDKDRSWRAHHRSRSRSPCRLDRGDDSYLIEEKGQDEHNPRRLRSVIIFAKESEEADMELFDPDVHKEEIIYDHDDYPSPKSNDSNDGDTKRDACPVQTGYLEDQHDEMVASKVSEISERRDLGVMVHDGNASAFSGAGLGDSLEEHKTKASTDTGSNATDLEAVLRQKALENLRKFKGGLRGNVKKPVSTKSSNDGEVKQLSNLNDDVECQKKDQEGSVGGVSALSVPRKIISTVGQHSSRTIQASSSLKRPAAESLHTLPQNSEMVIPTEEGSADCISTSKGSEVKVLAVKEGQLGANKRVKQAFPTRESPVKEGQLGANKRAKQAFPTPPLLSIPTTETLPHPVKDAERVSDSIADVNKKHETGASILIQCLGSNKLDRQLSPIPESSVPESVPAENKGTIENVQSFDDTKILTEVDKTTTVGEPSNTKENKEEDSQFQQKTMSCHARRGDGAGKLQGLHPKERASFSQEETQTMIRKVLQWLLFLLMGESCKLDSCFMYCTIQNQIVNAVGCITCSVLHPTAFKWR